MLPNLVFFPERRHPIRSFLLKPLLGPSQRRDSGDYHLDADDLDLTLPRPKRPETPPGPPQGGIKLWQLLAVLFTLFAGHYKLVELTVSGTARDIRNEIALAQQRGDGRYDDVLRRLQQLEADKSAVAARQGAMEGTDARQDREMTEMRLYMRTIMRKLNIEP